MIVAVFLTGLVVVCSASCPHQRQGLKRWSDVTTWNAHNKLLEGDSVFIAEPILLDESPPDLENITIETGGSLVADPESKVTLRAANIYVWGSLEIGSEECLFDGELTITLTGTRESHAGEKNPKVILVQNGGILEIHGKSKLPWTKISRTVGPSSAGEVYFEHKTSENADVEYYKKGLSIYTFTIDTEGMPQFKQFGVYDLVWEGKNFADHINNVADGDMVMMSTQRYIHRDDSHAKSQQFLAYDALETLLYGEVNNAGILRSVPDDGTTYGLIYQKGNTDSLVEITKPLGEGFRIHYIWNDKLVFAAETGSGPNYYYHLDNFRISDIDAAFPLLDVIDDVSSWMPGDKLIVTSTDYDWQQTEERTVFECNTCTARQLRVNAPFEYTHFGKIIKGNTIDMRAEIALLTRNVVIEGEMEDTCPPGNGNCDDIYVYGWDTFGAHVKVLYGYASVHIEGVELRNVGQHTDLGRYPLHFHMCLDPPDSSNPPYIKEVSIHHSFARCITIHGTNEVQLIDNVCYDHIGHGYFLEDGSEKGTLFDGNLAVGARRGSTDLEPTDVHPTSFWITNPNVRFVNNFAAGGQGTGIWFVFPDEPMGPSKHLNAMDLYEAKSTAVTQFYNNVAHSNVHKGIMFGNRLTASRTLMCCNHWQPRADPKDPESDPIEISISKITAYKNRRLNIWAEGGLINWTHISVSDSTNGIMVHNDQLVDRFSGRLMKSVIVDNSENIGEPEEGDSRSIPMYWERNAPHTGVTMWFGPTKFSELWLDGFEQNDLYDTGAIGLKRDSPYLFPMTNEFRDIQHAFDDGPGLSNLAITGTFGVNPGWPDDDGQKVTGFTWYRNMPEGVRRYYVVRPDHLSAAADDCKVRSNWRLAICETKYGDLKLRLRKADKNKGAVYVRDDLPSAQVTMKMEFTNGPQVVLDGSRSYTVHFLGEIPGEMRIKGEGMEIGDVLRVGFCLPKDAVFRISSFWPYRLRSADYFTKVNSLEELDAESSELDGKKYFYDDSTGMLYYKFINNKDRGPNEWNSCADGKCPYLNIYVDSGTMDDADCRERLYGDKLNMPKPALPTFDDVLPATGASVPPQGWGAGVTRPFTTRDVVDGGLSDWTGWSRCSVSCGDGTQRRIRKCDTPRPQNGGKDCEGPLKEEKPCFDKACPIDGDFSEWTTWGECQKTDDCAGFSRRTRECSNPEPRHGGIYCTGAVDEVQPCTVC
ncbi:cell surface hyaluronidase-like [Mercenaria mercenaria]|uniref:cell surface hyaluronidase-like n=1 Tax=Mercenaria mercenaria TaxID=6596 RepID=UPI00234F575C|nr:cell surface hyaluronidase-like [Mercenaria mercenaria]